MPWTPEQIDQLRALAPLSSPLEISRILGMTKNAVMGKMHRLGIAIRDARKPRPILRAMVGEYIIDDSPPDLAEWTKPDPKLERLLQNSKPVKIVLAPLPPPVVVAPVLVAPLPILELVCEGVDFTGLKRHSCRYPVKCDHNGFIRLYCGESARPESSWCGFHEKIVWLPAFERRRA